jgi:hypothetical protein
MLKVNRQVAKRTFKSWRLGGKKEKMYGREISDEWL